MSQVSLSLIGDGHEHPQDACPSLINLVKYHWTHLELKRAPTCSALRCMNVEGEVNSEFTHTNINSPRIFLSSPEFSLARELQATIQFLYQGPSSNVCRFPVRYLWLRSQLHSPKLPLAACADYQEFIQRAPADTISMVFASENISQPSSMMGHVFLKLHGTNRAGKPVDHAISFYTDAGGLNIPKLFFDSMVIGKKGFFALSPYEEKLKLYLGEEQRSVWEYTLRLDANQRELIQAHLIELKQTELTYFFQKYNCATVVDFILAIGAGRQLENTGFWLTPKDVVKHADELKIIESSQVHPPNRWLIRALGEGMSASERAEIKAAVELERLPNANDADAPHQAKRHALAEAYLGYLEEQSKISTGRAKNYHTLLNQKGASGYQDLQFNLDSFRNPIASPQDSQWTLGVLRRQDRNYTNVTITPASHHLEDDNRHYYSENELVLFEASLLKSLDNRQLILDRFLLYSTKSLIPYDSMSGGISGGFRVGMEPQYGDHLKSKRTTFVGGAIGMTNRIVDDVDIYGNFGFGVSNRIGEFRLYAQPELGLILREVFDMKTTLSISHQRNLTGDHPSLLRWRIEHAKYFPNKPWSLHFFVERQTQQSQHSDEISLRIRYLF